MAIATNAIHSIPKTTIRSNELLSSFDQYTSKIKVLSLDCFDTLIWRQTAEPRDVFYDLEHHPTFKSMDFTAATRINAEKFAYHTSKLKMGFMQAKLPEIYRSGFPELSDAEVKQLIAEEFAAELAVCYAFPPTIELIRKAKANGLKIIIVSDTYFDENQLRELLKNKLPADAFSAIDHIFCSCEFNKGKSEGLFQSIQEKLNLPLNSILHIGDNVIADHLAPKAMGVNTLHLVHHEEHMAELMRMYAVSASFIDPTIRNSRGLLNPFRSLIAHHVVDNRAESIIGYATMGPIMYAFANFVRSEISRLKQENKKPKIVFLMRDAYLPMLASEAFTGEKIGIPVRISRFASYASSFRSEKDIDNYLATRIKSGRFDDICKQLLLPEALSKDILAKIKPVNNPAELFTQLIHQEKILNTIYQQSKIYRQRLFKHLQKEIQLESGETLVFVDLGYSGTAQNRLAPVFKDELNVDIFGCYLIALRTPNWKASRRGLLDATHFDDKTLTMFTAHIALIEQICTSTERSVVDYDDQGNAIYSDITVSDQQHQKLKPLHDECIRFIHDAKKFIPTLNFHLTNDMLREAAAFNLCRIIYLPTKVELDYFTNFHMDFNVGTDIILPIFDLDKGLTSLKKRTWLYSAREHVKNLRLNYPAEWRAANLELAITLMAQMKFGLEVAPNDLTQRSQFLTILILHNNQVTPLRLEAKLTFDGYYSVFIPIVEGNSKLAIQFGLNYKWVELDSAELIPHKAVYTNMESEHAEDASNYLSGEELVDKSGGLFECLSENSLLIFNRPDNLGKQNYILRVVFRPIVWRN